MAKLIEGYNGYTIKEDGTIVSTKKVKPKILKPQRASQSKKGYLQVRLFNQKYPKGRLQYVHRLVWETFKGEIRRGLEIDHIDGNPRNNQLSNLQLLTRRGNGIKASRDNYGVFLRDYREELIQDYKTLGTFKKVAEKWGKSIPAVYRVIRNRTHYVKPEGGYSTRVYDEKLSDEWTQN